MKIKTLDTAGFIPALHAMRNPMNSWNKADSYDYTGVIEDGKLEVGSRDKELSLKLQKAGPEHCKHLRMIYVWADITAPRMWWTEFDTYRQGVEKISCSTMHKLMARPLTLEDFEYSSDNESAIESTIRRLNGRIQAWNDLRDTDPDEAQAAWRETIELLPQSYLQTRTVCMSYAALRNIVRQRKGHKLKEWMQFITWARTLPESWMIFDDM